MFRIPCIFSLVILYIFGQSAALVTLPKVEENDILKTEVVIRNTTNVLFSSLRITNIRDKTWAKEKSLIHNYFVSQTLQDYNTLKEIAKLTRVDKSDIENVTADFIALLNEILDEKNILNLENTLNNEDGETRYNIEDEVEKLNYLNRINLEEDSQINKQVLDIIQKTENLQNNTRVDNSSNNFLDENTFWHETDNFYGARRIFDGKRTKIKHFPFMTSIEIFNKFQCAGCIIKSDLVITAASCLQLAWNNRYYRENPPFLSVRIGSSFYEIGGERIGVQEVYFHPSYKPKNLENNLALIRLERKINLKKKNVKKIHIDKETHKLSNKAGRVEIIGWGATTRSNKLHGSWEDKLKHALLHIYPHDECRELYSKEYVTKTNFCAGYISKGTGACNRDIGGPGIISGTLVGIISFGSPSCGTPDAPTVFTKLGFYYDWIEEIMEKDIPTYRKRTTLKHHTWSYQNKHAELVPLTKSPIINKLTTKSPIPLRYTHVKKKYLRASKHKTTKRRASKKKLSNLKLRNEDNSLKHYFETMFENKGEENKFSNIELPKEQNDTNNIPRVINNVNSINPIKFQSFIQQPIAIEPIHIKNPKQQALRLPPWNVQRPPKHGIKKKRTKKNIKTTRTYPEVFIESPFFIDNTPTKVKIDLEQGNKSYTLIKNNYHQKILLPDDISNIEIELIANNTQQNDEASTQKIIPIESLRNQLSEFINTAEQEQKARQMQLKSHVMQIIGNTETLKKEISPEEIQNILMGSKSNDFEKHDLILHNLGYQKSQNLNNRIKVVLADSNLSNKEKHDFILQLVTGHDLTNNNIKNNAAEPNFRLPHAIEEVSPSQFHIVDNNEGQTKESEQVPYQKNHMSYVSRNLINYEQKQDNSIFPAINLDLEPYNIERNMVKEQELPEDNMQLNQQEKYIMNVLKDPKLLKNEQYDLIMQATNVNLGENNINSNFSKGRELYEGNTQLKEQESYITNSLENKLPKNKYDLLSHLLGTSQQAYSSNSKAFKKEQTNISNNNILRAKSEKNYVNSIDKLGEKIKQQESDKYDFFLKTIIKNKEIQNQIDESVNEIVENEKNTDNKHAKNNNLKQELIDLNLQTQNKNTQKEQQHNLEPKTEDFEHQQNILRYVTKDELGNLGFTESSLLEYFDTVNNQQNIVLKKSNQDAIFQNAIKGLSESEGDETYVFQSSTQENVQREESTTENINLYNVEISKNHNNPNTIYDKSLLASEMKYQEDIENKLKTILIAKENDKFKDYLMKSTNEIWFKSSMHNQSDISNGLNKNGNFDTIIKQILDNPELQDEQKEKYISQILGTTETFNVTENNLVNPSPIEKLQIEIQWLDQAAAQDNESRTKKINDTITEIFNNLGNDMQYMQNNDFVYNTIHNILNDNKMDDESKYKAIMQSVTTNFDNLDSLRNKNMLEDYQIDDLENNIQNILSNSKMDDDKKYKTIMNLIGDQSNAINNELDTLRNQINQTQNNLIPFENLQNQIEILDKAETQEREERAKLAYNQILEIMNSPKLNFNKYTGYPAIIENNINEVHSESLIKDNTHNEGILRSGSENTSSPSVSFTESTFNIDKIQPNKNTNKGMIQEFGATYLQNQENTHKNLQPVESETQVTAVIKEQNNNYKQFDSAIYSNLDSMLDFVKSFKPKMNENSTQATNPQLKISSNKLTQSDSHNGTAYFENIFQSLSELEKYTGGGQGIKIMNTVAKNKENNDDTILPSFALPVLKKDSTKLQNMETDELITLLSSVLTPQEAMVMPVQFDNETKKDSVNTFSSEIVSIGSNFENMKNNLQNIFSLLPQYEIDEQDFIENDTNQVVGEKEEELIQQVHNQDIPTAFLRSHVNELENLMPSYINLLQNKNVSKNKVAEILSRLLSEEKVYDEPNNLMLPAGNSKVGLDTLMAKYNKLLQNEYIVKNKVANILATLLSEETDNNQQSNRLKSFGNDNEEFVNLLETYDNLLRNENIAKNKVAEILSTLLSEQSHNNQQNDKLKLVGNNEEEFDGFMTSYNKLPKNENISKNKVASTPATLLSEESDDDKQNDRIASASAVSYNDVISDITNTMYTNNELNNQNKVNNLREESDWNEYTYQTTILPNRIREISYSSTLPPSLLVTQELSLKRDDLRLDTKSKKETRIDTTNNIHTNNGITFLKDNSEGKSTWKKDKNRYNTIKKYKYFSTRPPLLSLKQVSLKEKENTIMDPKPNKDAISYASATHIETYNIYSSTLSSLVPIKQYIKVDKHVNVEDDLNASEIQKIKDRENEVALVKLENTLKSQKKDISKVKMSKTNMKYEQDYISDSLNAILPDNEIKNASLQLASVNSQANKNTDKLDKKYSEEENRIPITENIKQTNSILSTSSPVLTKTQGGIFKFMSNSIFSAVGGAAKQISTVIESQKIKTYNVNDIDKTANHSILVTNGNTDSQQKVIKLENTNNLLRNEYIPSKLNVSHPIRNNILKDMTNNFFGFLGAAGKVKSKALEHLGSGLGPKSAVIKDSNKSKDLRDLHSEDLIFTEFPMETINQLQNVNNEELILFSQKDSNLLENNITTSASTVKEDIVKKVRDGFFNILGKVKNTALQQFGTDVDLQKPKGSHKTKNYTTLETFVNIETTKIEPNSNFKDELLSITPSASSFIQQDGELKKLADEFLMVLGNPNALKEEKNKAIIHFASAVESQRKNNVTDLRSPENDYRTLQPNYYSKPSKHGDSSDVKF